MSSDHGSRLRDQLSQVIAFWRHRANAPNVSWLDESTYDGMSVTYHVCADELDDLLRASASAPPEDSTPANMQLQDGDARYLRGIVRAHRIHGGTVFQPTNVEVLERVLWRAGLYSGPVTIAEASALSPDPSALREAANPPATHAKDIRAIVSSYGYLLMRLAVAKDAQDTFDVCKKEFEENEAALKRLQDAFIHNKPDHAAALASPRETEPADIDVFWAAVSNGWDIEDRSYFEREAVPMGFKCALEMAVHHMWKRHAKHWPNAELKARLSGSSSEERGENTKTKI